MFNKTKQSFLQQYSKWVWFQNLSPSSLGKSEQQVASSSQESVGLCDSVPVTLCCSLPDRISCLRMAGSYGFTSNFKCTCTGERFGITVRHLHDCWWLYCFSNSWTYLHELGNVPYANLPPLGCCSKKMRAATEPVAHDLIWPIWAGELGRAGGQGDGERNILGVLSFYERTVGRMALMLGPKGQKRGNGKVNSNRLRVLFIVACEM